MAGAIAEPLSIAAFRAWLESRPDEEHWELIAGVPMMMAPATKAHQRIASNLERLLNDALEVHRPACDRLSACRSEPRAGRAGL